MRGRALLEQARPPGAARTVRARSRSANGSQREFKANWGSVLRLCSGVSLSESIGLIAKMKRKITL